MKAFLLVATAGLVFGCNAQLSDATRKDIEKQMRAQHSAFERCYQQVVGKKVGPDTPQGTARLRLDVMPSGRASNVRLEGELKSAALASCVVAEAKKLVVFAKPDRRVDVSFPLSFSASTESR